MTAQPRPSPVRVVVVGADGVLGGLVRLTIAARHGVAVVGEAATANGALRIAEREQPDAVILDRGVPDLNGSEVLTALRAAAPLSRIVIFSGSDAPDHDVAAPIDGYVENQNDLDVLVQAIHATPLPIAASLQLETREGAVRQSRRFLAAHCERWRCHDLIDDALVVISELVSNAIRHARTATELRVRFGSGVLRVEVVDGVPEMPEPRTPGADDHGGRGLLLVGALSQAWGVDPLGHGKVVWAELSQD